MRREDGCLLCVKLDEVRVDRSLVCSCGGERDHSYTPVPRGKLLVHTDSFKIHTHTQSEPDTGRDAPTCQTAPWSSCVRSRRSGFASGAQVSSFSLRET